VPKSEAPGAPRFSGCAHFSRHLGHQQSQHVRMDLGVIREEPERPLPSYCH